VTTRRPRTLLGFTRGTERARPNR